jgi:hypothetical protein
VARAGERDKANRAQRFADGSRRMAIVNSDSCPSVFETARGQGNGAADRGVIKRYTSRRGCQREWERERDGRKRWRGGFR